MSDKRVSEMTDDEIRTDLLGLRPNSKAGQAEGNPRAAELRAAIEALIDDGHVDLNQLRALLADNGAARHREVKHRVWLEGSAHAESRGGHFPEDSPHKGPECEPCGSTDDVQVVTGDDGEPYDFCARCRVELVPTPHAADLPDGTVVARPLTIWRKRAPNNWEATGSVGRWDDRELNDILAAGARVLRYGHDGGDSVA